MFCRCLLATAVRVSSLSLRLSTVVAAPSSSSSRRLIFMKPVVVFVLGGPGAGKGTQCSLIVETDLVCANSRRFRGQNELLYGEQQANLPKAGTLTETDLLNIYMKPLGEVIRRCGLRNHQYADDTQLYLSFSTNPGEAVAVLNRCLAEKYGYTHLSAGDLLRDERKRPGSQYGELIENYIKDGKIVPVEITISLLKRAMAETMAANAQKNKFLIDGFPRNEDNLQGWNKTMDGKADVSFVLFFDCDNEVCINRCLERGKSSGRSDDNRESLEKRIHTYLESTKPIVDLYEKTGKVRKVDASKSVDEVFGEVVTIFDKEG
ncbi:UMP-CMP kinase [Varanus komodoensis]|nr:UMP-CMP kinase [Varanus komodoensis]